MRKKYIITLSIALAALMLTACGGDAELSPSPATAPTAVQSQNVEPSADARDAIEAGYFSNRDFDSRYTEVATPTITFNGGTVEVSDNRLEVNENTVTIKLEGTYIISGTAADACIVVDVDAAQKVQLVLKNANIHSENSAPIYVKQADKVFITLAEGSDNSLSNGGQFSFAGDSKIDAVIYSRDDLTINGNGKLQLNSPAGHGIASNDSLSITGGSFEISCANNGLTANDDVTIADASFVINSGKDAVQAEHDTNPDKGFIYLLSSSFDIDTAGDAFSASSWIIAESGSFKIGADDDAFRAINDISVNGGEFEISAGDNAFSADENITVSGGSINILNCTEQFKALNVSIAENTIK